MGNLLTICDFMQSELSNPGIFVAYKGDCSFIFQLPADDGRYAIKAPVLIIDNFGEEDVFIDVVDMADAIARANEFIRDNGITIHND